MLSLFNFECCTCTDINKRTDMVSVGGLFAVHAQLRLSPSKYEELATMLVMVASFFVSSFSSRRNQHEFGKRRSISSIA